MSKEETAIKRAILADIGSRPDMMVEQRDVGFDEMRKIKYGTKGEADIRVLWKRKYRMSFQNHRNPFHQLDKVVERVVGQAVAIEVKTPRKGSKQSKEQKAWQKAWEDMGGIYIIARSVEECREAIQALEIDDQYLVA